MGILDSRSFYEAQEKMKILIKAAEIVSDCNCIDNDDYINDMYAIMDSYSITTDFAEAMEMEEQFIDMFTEAVYWSKHG